MTRNASSDPSQDKPGSWDDDGTGVRPGGDVGGDVQAGESYSVRYRRPDRPYAMITRTAYPAEAAEQQGMFFVQVQTEWLVCSDPLDPGGTEVWSESTTDDEPRTYTSAKEAGLAAREIATSLLSDGASHDWDGLPPQ